MVTMAYIVPFPISVENHKFFPPRSIFTSPLTGSPWNWVSAQGVTKTRIMELPDGLEKVLK